MKGIHALIIAAGLGLAGAIVNFAYLSSRAREIETVEFIGIPRDASIARGDKLTVERLEKVRIPRALAEGLKNYAVLWSAVGTVENYPVCRTLSGGSLLLQDDIRTPPPELDLGPGDEVRWIPVDSRRFVPSLVVPGDMVSFEVASLHLASPLSPDPEKPASGPDSVIESIPKGPTEVIGPFKVLAVGNRLGTPEVMRAAKISQLQEGVLGIRVSPSVTGERELANKLRDRLQATGFRQVGIILHSRKAEKK
jgi:hypothetical protein